MIENIELYRKFAAVAKRDSISAAAKDLHITQAALSVDIQNLEYALGTALFFRHSKGVRLTGAGEVLYEHARTALESLEKGEDSLRDMIGLKSGLMRIGASDMTLRFYLLDYLQQFRDIYPDVKINVTNAPTPQTIAALRNGEIDFGAVTQDRAPSPDDKQNNDITFIPVREIRDIFICSDKYDIANKTNVSADEITEYPLIMLEEKITSTRQYVQSFFDKTELNADIELATSDLLLEFAIRDLGISSIVEDFASEAIAAGKVKKIDLHPEIPPRQMCIAYLKKRPLSATAKEMFKLMGIDAPRN
jgi:Transcriptional regulator